MAQMHPLVARHNPVMERNLIHMTTSSLKEALKNDKEIVFVGIGTPLVSGDSFGPALADCLKEAFSSQFPIYGGSDNPIHNMNYIESFKEIKRKHPNSFVIGLDAFLSRSETIGLIRYSPKIEIEKYQVGVHPSTYSDAMILGHTVNRDLGRRGLYNLSKRCIRCMVEFAYETIVASMKKLGLAT